MNQTEIVFSNSLKDAEGRHNANLDLQNDSDSTLFYKVKTTDPSNFIVRPNLGVLEPASSTNILI